MNKEIKVVIGANYGDEGKGLVTYCLTKEASRQGRKVLNVLYNGGSQRGHTANGVIHHALGSGTTIGADTYLNQWFMVDPIALWLEQAEVYIHPSCRLVLPCDVVNNQQKELERGEKKHGSCGMGIYEACLRSSFPEYNLKVSDLYDIPNLYDKLIRVEKKFGYPKDLVYNNENFMRAAKWVSNNCNPFENEERLFDYFDTIIFEGGQGLLLDQIHIDKTKNLTPSSPGIRNCISAINKCGIQPDLFYVSRTYQTRHGVGEMENECHKDNINALIEDETNQPNPWQDTIRYGYLDPEKLFNRVSDDVWEYYRNTKKVPKSTNIVFTHMNYTCDRIHLPDGTRCRPYIPADENSLLISHIYGSDKKDEMDILI